ncbi:MAG TPA: class I SAM-dependent methyltransferase [Candidatus Paceibacterota bacterium]|nr:class I SAM-dependent methyltransferase [Candidatus Paceibacterota bacterium]
MKKDSSWGEVASWYNDVVTGEGSYQRDLILPNLLRLMDIHKGDVVLDLACGQGFFSGEFAKAGASVIASDISPELVEIAKNNPNNKDVDFHVSPAENIDFLKDGSADKISVVLAIQNIEKVQNVFKEVSRVLRTGGKMFLILNHPAFRIPKESSWGYDDEKDIQFRMIDKYLSESKTEIDMNPGENKQKKMTVSFHRPIQYYFKILKNNGFCVGALEEWISNKTSGEGPRKKAEDKSRKEFPLFMALECIKK